MSEDHKRGLQTTETTENGWVSIAHDGTKLVIVLFQNMTSVIVIQEFR